MQEKYWAFVFESLLIFLIISAPLFCASLSLIPLSILQLVCLFLLFLFLIKLIVNPTSKIISPPSVVLILSFLLIAFFQLLPLPYLLLKVISPHTAWAYQEYLPTTNLNLYPLTVYPFETKQEIVKFISYLSIFFIVINVVERREAFKRLLAVLIISSALLSLYGVMRKYFILEMSVTATFSTFMNRNHFAAYMTLIAPLAIGYALSYTDIVRRFLFGFIAALICSCIFLSFSRAGSISLMGSLVLMTILFNKERLVKGRYWVLGIVMVLLIIFISMVDIEPLKVRFLEIKKDQWARILPAQNALNILKDFPLLGIGWGNFRYIFTLYQSFVSTSYYSYLHNDHLQFALEVGIICFSLYALFLLSIGREIIARLNERHDPFARSITIGGLSGLPGVLLHSFVDFNFHIPALSFMFWFILGLIYKCVHTHFYKK